MKFITLWQRIKSRCHWKQTDLDKAKANYMAALQNLQSAISNLTVAVQALPQATTTTGTGASEADVQAAADAIDAQTKVIVAKSTPVAQ